MYERFTNNARKVMQLANQEARRFNHNYVGTEHILLGLIKEGYCGIRLGIPGMAMKVLKNLDVDPRKIRLEVENLMQSGPDNMATMGKLPQSPGMKKVIEYSIEEARNLNHSDVGTEHILLGLLREQEGVAAQVLMHLGLTLEKVREEVRLLNLSLKLKTIRDKVRRLGETITQPFSIPYNATDPVDIMNAVMRFEDPPPQDKRWEIRIAALCEVVAARNKETARLREEVVRLAGEKEAELEAPPWRTMESAPRDGTEVLLQVEYRAGISGKCLVGHYLPGGHCIEDHPSIDEGWYFWNNCMFDKASKPIAWMLIPEATEPIPEPEAKPPRKHKRLWSLAKQVTRTIGVSTPQAGQHAREYERIVSHGITAMADEITILNCKLRDAVSRSETP